MANSPNKTDKKSIIGRMVRINLWTDDKFPFMSDDAQSVWFHVYTNPLTNGLGLYHATLEGLAGARRWSLERYRKGFLECLDNGLFVYDETFQVVYFPRFLKHNKPSNPNVLKNLILCWDYIPNSIFKTDLKASICALGASYKAIMKDCAVTLPQTLPQTTPETGSGSGSGTGSDKNYAITKEIISKYIPEVTNTCTFHGEEF